MKKLIAVVLMMLAGVNLLSCVYGQETADPEQAGASGTALIQETQAAAQVVPDEGQTDVQPGVQEETQAAAQGIVQTEAPVGAQAAKQPPAQTEPQDMSANGRLHPLVTTSSLWDEENDEKSDRSITYAEMKYSTVSLSAKEAQEYPQLAKGLKAYYDAFGQKRQESYKQMDASARQDITAGTEAEESEGDSGVDRSYYRDENTTKVVRADDRILSMRDSFYSFTGGAHGYYSRSGVTFDVKTGKILRLCDVVTDVNAAAQRVTQLVEKRYPDLQMQMSEEEIAGAFAQEKPDNGVHDDEGMIFGWTMEPEGIVVYFQPYILGSYADGIQAVMLSSAENKDLIRPEYCQTQDSWILPVDDLTGACADTGSGSAEWITVGGQPDEYGQITDRMITIGGNEQTIDSGNLMYYSTDAYLVRKDGKCWIWCIDSEDNDYRTLHVYAIENGSASDTGFSGNMGVPATDGGVAAGSSVAVPNSYTEEPLTDPDCVKLESRMDALGTYGGYKHYLVSGDGLPAPMEQWYLPQKEISLTLQQDYTFTMVGTDGTGTAKQTWPAGTIFHLLRTDNETFADLNVAGDMSQVARVFCDFSQWPHMYGTVEEDALFSGTVYAG